MIKHVGVEPVISKPCGTRSIRSVVIYLNTLVEHTFRIKYSN